MDGGELFDRVKVPAPWHLLLGVIDDYRLLVLHTIKQIRVSIHIRSHKRMWELSSIEWFVHLAVGCTGAGAAHWKLLGPLFSCATFALEEDLRFFLAYTTCTTRGYLNWAGSMINSRFEVNLLITKLKQPRQAKWIQVQRFNSPYVCSLTSKGAIIVKCT